MLATVIILLTSLLVSLWVTYTIGIIIELIREGE